MPNSADNTTCTLPQWLQLLLSPPIKAHTRPSPDHDPSTSLLLEKGLLLPPSPYQDDQEMRYAAQLTKRTLPVALALPWVVSMLMSWIPFTKIGLSEAPTFLTLAAVVSTLEVLSIVAVFVYTSISPAESVEPGRLSTLQEKFLRAWFWFLFISPFVSSILVVLLASDKSCDEDEDLDVHQPICKVGIRLIKATALCRAAIIAIFLFAMSSWLDSPKPVELKSPRKPSRDIP